MIIDTTPQCYIQFWGIAAIWQAEQAHISGKEKQEVPAGELPANLSVCGFFRVRAIQGRAMFLFYLNLPADYSSSESSASTRSIR